MLTYEFMLAQTTLLLIAFMFFFAIFQWRDLKNNQKYKASTHYEYGLRKESWG